MVRYALAGLLQLLLSFLVSVVSGVSTVGFFPRRKRAMVEERTRRNGVEEVGKWERDETAAVSARL